MNFFRRSGELYKDEEGDVAPTAGRRFGELSLSRLIEVRLPRAFRNSDGDEFDVDPENALDLPVRHAGRCFRGLLRDGVVEAELRLISAKAVGEGMKSLSA